MSIKSIIFISLPLSSCVHSPALASSEDAEIVPFSLCYSVVSYWEGFSTHAFENTTQNFFQSISLALDAGEVNPCTCCFTIRRDVSLLPVNLNPLSHGQILT